MEPVSTVAIAVAALVAKAAEHLGEKIWAKVSDDAADKVSGAVVESGWNVLSRMAVRVRSWFAGHGEADGVTAIETVVAAPDSKLATDRLAEAVRSALEADPELEKEVRGYVEAAQAGEGSVATFTVQAWGHAKIGKILQINQMNADTIEI
jgi:hypothetical protein